MIVSSARFERNGGGFKPPVTPTCPLGMNLLQRGGSGESPVIFIQSLKRGGNDTEPTQGSRNLYDLILEIKTGRTSAHRIQSLACQVFKARATIEQQDFTHGVLNAKFLVGGLRVIADL